jgi:Xaa-Pro aminopeptidase
VFLMAALFVPHAALRAQFGFTSAFPPSEFAARRAKVMERIGDGVAVIQGGAALPASMVFRQNNHFFYLTGVEASRAVLVIDGRARRSTLLLPPRNEREERSTGPVIGPDEATRARVGVEVMMTRDSVMQLLTSLAREGRPLFAPFRPEVQLEGGYVSHSTGFEAANLADPLDGRKSRERVLVEKLRELSGKDVQNLDPILDALRFIKSPAEIAAIREATRIAELGIMEAMKYAEPGMYEYELTAAADLQFKINGAQGFGYTALAATGTNAAWPHYRFGKTKLAANDLVLFDYAPDWNYYTSDVTRMFPASGTFTPRNREMYTIYLRLYQALASSIKTKVAPRDIIKEAVVKMDRVMAGFTFTDPKIKEAAVRFVESYRTNTRNSLGHTVGMEVHDTNMPFETLMPGMVFTIEPALTIPDERIYVRLEDVFLVTETGVENLSTMAPEEPDAIERLMKEKGLGVRATSRPPIP